MGSLSLHLIAWSITQDVLGSYLNVVILIAGAVAAFYINRRSATKDDMEFLIKQNEMLRRTVIELEGKIDELQARLSGRTDP